MRLRAPSRGAILASRRGKPPGLAAWARPRWAGLDIRARTLVPAGVCAVAAVAWWLRPDPVHPDLRAPVRVLFRLGRGLVVTVGRMGTGCGGRRHRSNPETPRPPAEPHPTIRDSGVRRVIARWQLSPAGLALSVTIAAAVASRFSWLNLMEFKGDEAEACRLALHALGYSEPGVGRFFPTQGLTSSIGVPNPPLFVYLMAVPLAIVRSPLAAVSAVAAANVASIWVCYVAGKRCFSPFVGLASAALLALSPWGIVFSRKIWAQDLLPLCSTLFILEVHALLVRRKPAAVFWLFVITAVATPAALFSLDPCTDSGHCAPSWPQNDSVAVATPRGCFRRVALRAVFDRARRCDLSRLRTSSHLSRPRDRRALRSRRALHFRDRRRRQDVGAAWIPVGHRRTVLFVLGPSALIGSSRPRAFAENAARHVRLLLAVWFLLPLARSRFFRSTTTSTTSSSPCRCRSSASHS